MFKGQGHFLAFLDTDDTWSDEFLESRSKHFYDDKYDFFIQIVFIILKEKNLIYNLKLDSGKIFDF